MTSCIFPGYGQASYMLAVLKIRVPSEASTERLNLS